MTVFFSEAVVFQIERIASGPCSSTVELALPLNATKGTKLSFATVIGTRLFARMAFNSPTVHS